MKYLDPPSGTELATTGRGLSRFTGGQDEVLGRRRVELASVTTRSFEIPGNWYDWDVSVLRDHRGGTLFIVGSQIWNLSGAETTMIPRPDRPMPWFVGWLVLIGWLTVGLATVIPAMLAII